MPVKFRTVESPYTKGLPFVALLVYIAVATAESISGGAVLNFQEPSTLYADIDSVKAERYLKRSTAMTTNNQTNMPEERGRIISDVQPIVTGSANIWLQFARNIDQVRAYFVTSKFRISTKFLQLNKKQDRLWETSSIQHLLKGYQSIYGNGLSFRTEFLSTLDLWFKNKELLVDFLTAGQKIEESKELASKLLKHLVLRTWMELPAKEIYKLLKLNMVKTDLFEEQLFQLWVKSADRGDRNQMLKVLFERYRTKADLKAALGTRLQNHQDDKTAKKILEALNARRVRFKDRSANESMDG